MDQLQQVYSKLEQMHNFDIHLDLTNLDIAQRMTRYWEEKQAMEVGLLR